MRVLLIIGVLSITLIAAVYSHLHQEVDDRHPAPFFVVAARTPEGHAIPVVVLEWSGWVQREFSAARLRQLQHAREKPLWAGMPVVKRKELSGYGFDFAADDLARVENELATYASAPGEPAVFNLSRSDKEGTVFTLTRTTNGTEVFRYGSAHK